MKNIGDIDFPLILLVLPYYYRYFCRRDRHEIVFFFFLQVYDKQGYFVRYFLSFFLRSR